MPIYPITFSIPESKLVKRENCITKTQFFASLIPGDLSTYIYTTEKDYYESYQKCYYAITTKKAGWDCLRHYEILANNCIPYFVDIENCPINTMALFPKELIIQSNRLCERIIENHNIHKIYNTELKQQKEHIFMLTENEIKEYNDLLDRLFLYTKNNLTPVAISNYILKQTNYENVSKILFLNGCIMADYLRCLTLSGFKTTFGKKCHEYPIVPHLYNDKNIDSTTSGFGFSYTHILDPELRVDNLTDETVIDNIIQNYYDIIIYGSYHRGTPFWDIVVNSYSYDKIIMLCGEDIHECDYKKYSDLGIHMFIREL